MARLAQLGIAIDSAPARQGAQEVKTVLGDLESSAQRVTRNLQAAAGALGLAFGVRQLIEYADQFKMIEGRLALVTRGTAELEAVQRSLFTLAQNSGQAFGDVAQLYTRIARSAGELGASQQDMLGVTEAVGLALRVSGTSSTQAAGALFQLSQAFTTGTVKAEELNSVMEGAPRVAQAAADGLGISLGQLRQRLLDGQLTSEAFFNAILTQLPKLKEEADSLPPTVGAAFTALNNSIGALVAGTDDAVGASQVFASTLKSTATFIDEYRTAIESLVTVAGAGGLGLVLARGVTGLAAFGAANVAMAASVGTATAALAGAQVAANAFWVAVTGPIGRAVAAMAVVGTYFALWRDGAKEAAKEVQNLGEALAKTTDISAASRELAKAEADRVAALKTLQTGGLVGEDLRKASAALTDATERTNRWTEKLKELRAATTSAGETVDPFAAKLRDANGALDAFRRGGDAGVQAFKMASEEWSKSGNAAMTFAAALDSGDASARRYLESAERVVRATSALTSAQEKARKATRDREADARRLGEIQSEFFLREIEFWNWLAERDAARKSTEAYASDLRSLATQIAALENEQAALLEGADAYRQYQVAMAQAAAVREALAKNPAMSEEEIRQLKARIALVMALEAGNERLRQGLSKERSAFELPAVAETKSFVQAIGDVLELSRGIASAFGDVGRTLADIVGGLGSAAQGLERLQRAADRTTKDGTRIGLGGAITGAGGTAAFVEAAAGASGILTGVFSVINGFVESARQKAIEMREAAERFEEALETFRRAASGSLSTVYSQLLEIQKAYEAASRDLFTSGKGASSPEQIELNRAARERVQRLGADYLGGLGETLSRLMGDTMTADIARAEREFAERRASLADLLTSKSISEDEYQRALLQSQEILERTTQAIRDAAQAEEARLAAVEAQRQRTLQLNNRDLTLRERAVRGDDVSADRLRLDGDRELEQARKLVESGELTAEMFERLAAVIEGEVANAIRAAEEAAAQAAAALRDDLAVRTLLAQGKDAEAAALRREIAWRAELVGITDAALLAQLEYVQQLEKEALVKAELEAAAERAIALEQQRLAQNQSIDVRMLRAQGRDEDASALEQQIARERELREAVDESTRARLRELFAMEDAAAAAAKAAEALKEQARQAERLAGLTFDLNIDLLEAEGNTFEAQRQRIIQRGEQRRRELIESGASADVLANLDRLIQRQLDNLIRSTIETATEAIRETTSRDVASGGTMAYNRTGVQTLSEGTGMRLVDVALSQLITLRSIDRKVGGASAGGVTVQVSVAGFVAGTPQQLGREIAQAVAPLVDESLGRRVGIDRRLTGTVGL